MIHVDLLPRSLSTGRGDGDHGIGLVADVGRASVRFGPSEAGHIRFHPATAPEARLADAMASRGSRYLDAETLLSAGG